MFKVIDNLPKRCSHKRNFTLGKLIFATSVFFIKKALAMRRL